VIGHHPHVIQPFEVHRGKPIFYSVGNFAFGSGNSRGEGLLLAIRFCAGRDGRRRPSAVRQKPRPPRRLPTEGLAGRSFETSSRASRGDLRRGRRPPLDRRRPRRSSVAGRELARAGGVMSRISFLPWLRSSRRKLGWAACAVVIDAVSDRASSVAAQGRDRPDRAQDGPLGCLSSEPGSAR